MTGEEEVSAARLAELALGKDMPQGVQTLGQYIKHLQDEKAQLLKDIRDYRRLSIIFGWTAIGTLAGMLAMLYT